MAIPYSKPRFCHQDWLSKLKNVKYPAKNHYKAVKSHFVSVTNKDPMRSYFFISGEKSVLYPYSDQSPPFRQNRYFYYLTGCNIPGAHVLYSLATDKSTLYLPEVDADDIMWSGMPMSVEEAQKTFDVDDVVYASSVTPMLHEIATRGANTVYTTDTKNADSAIVPYLCAGNKDFFYALDEARLIKDDYELSLMRNASQITDNAHFAVMSAKPIETNEGHIHAEFVYHTLRQGAKFLSYDPICCSGPNCGTLHYIKNDEGLKQRESVLIDAGAEWSCYASDVTRCWPTSGEWNKEHLEIYQVVLKMQTETLKLIKDGQSWEELHLLAHRIMIEEFLKLGIFKNGTAQEIFDSKVSATFFPHGLGHLLGMDTHDVGGRANYEDPDEMLCYLRIRRPLKAGMVVTDEPGVYFSPFLIDHWLKDENKNKYVDRKVMEKYMKIGGVRIEDDIIVLEDGYENLTQITKDPAEISKIVKAGLSKGKSGFHNIV